MDIYTFIMQTGGCKALLTDTAATVLLAALLTLGLRLLSRRLGLLAGNGRASAAEALDWREVLVLIAGLMTAAASYLADILALCGIV